ncbi:hypothetical protein ABFS83_06G064800 [Erythranthe nasuta]
MNPKIIQTAIKLMYDRDTPGYKPKDLEYCKPLVDLAIDTYNQQHSTHYRLVELIRVIGCVCSDFYFFMKYSATDSDSHADAKMFAADVFDGISETTIDSVYIVAEGESLRVDTIHARYF